MSNKIIFIDSDCSLCNRFVDLVFKFDKKEDFKFFLLNNDEGELKTIVYLEENQYFTRYSAISKVLSSTNIIFKIFFWFADFFPNFLTNFIYDFVADNRNKVFGTGYCTVIPQNRKFSQNEINTEVLSKATKLSLSNS